MKLKEINRTAIVSWSPAQHYPIYLASGTSAQQLDASFSTNASLEFFELNLADSSLDMKSCGTLSTTHRYHKLVWSPFGTDGQSLPSGVLIAGGENGSVILYDPAKIMAGGNDVVIAQSDRHTGPVRALDINPFQTNLVASGGNESEIYIWDLNNFGSPMTPGPKTQPVEDISCVAWNRQVQHILASSSPSGRTSVWDLRKNDLIIKVSDHSNRMHCSGMAWNPEVATQLVMASEDDRMPVIQMWDLRFAASPLKIFESHTRGVLAISWSSADPELLLSCGKDSRIHCCNPNTAEVLYELPTGSQWCFDIQWCPRNPAVFSAAGFDGYININSIMGGTSQAPSQRHVDQTSNSFNTIDPFGTGQTLPPLELPQSATLPTTVHPLKKPPKWIRTPAGASFAFGGKLVSLESGKLNPQQPMPHAVHVSQVVTETDLLKRSNQLQATLSSGQFLEFCQGKIDSTGNEFEKTVWSFLKAKLDNDSRTTFLELLGYTKEDLAQKISAALTEKSSEAKVMDLPCDVQPVVDASTVLAADVSEAEVALVSAAGLQSTTTQMLASHTETRQSLDTPAATFDLIASENLQLTTTIEQESAPVESEAILEVNAVDTSTWFQSSSDEKEEQTPNGFNQWDGEDVILHEEVTEPVINLLAPNDGVLQPTGEEPFLAPSVEVLHGPGEEMLEDPGAQVPRTPGEEILVDPSVEVLHAPGEEVLEDPSVEVLHAPGKELLEDPVVEVLHAPGEKLLEDPSVEVLHAPGKELLEDPIVEVLHAPGKELLEDPIVEELHAPGEELLEDLSVEVLHAPGEELLVDPSVEVLHAPGEELLVDPSVEVLHAPGKELLEDLSVELLHAPDEEIQVDPSAKALYTPVEETLSNPSVEVFSPDVPNGEQVLKKTIDDSPQITGPADNASLSFSRDIDGLITQALLIGDLEGAVELCLNDNRMADGIILAIAGGTQLLEKTQKKYFQKSKSKLNKLLSAVVMKDLRDILVTCEVQNWKEALAAVMTYSEPQEFISFCDLLGGRLDSTNDVQLKAQACLCYICSGNVEKLVSCWTKAQGDNSPLFLQDLVEKVVVIRHAVEQTQKTGPTAVGDLLAKHMSKYANLLASQGCLSTAITYLPDETNHFYLQQLRDRLIRALGHQDTPVKSVTSKEPPPAPKSNNPYSALHPSTTASAPLQYYQPVRAASTVTSWSNQTPTAFPHVPAPSPSGTASEQSKEESQSHMYGIPPTGTTAAAPAIYSHQYQTYPQVNQCLHGSGGLAVYQSHYSSVAPPLAEPSGLLYQYSQPAASQTQHTPLSSSCQNPSFISSNPPVFSTSSTSSLCPIPPTSFHHSGPGSPGACMQPPPLSGPPLSGISGPQNGWNDPPSLLRVSKKKMVPENYTPPAPITAPIMAPLGVDPQAQQEPSGFTQFVGQIPQEVQAQNSGMQQPLVQQAMNMTIPKTRTEGPPGAPICDVIQPRQSMPSEKVTKKPIPDEHLILKTTFEGLIQKCLAAANDPQTKRKLDDANKRMEALYDKLREQTLSPAIIGGLHNIARTIDSRSYTESLNHHTHIVSSSNFSEISGFMPVLKVVLTQANKLGV